VASATVAHGRIHNPTEGRIGGGRPFGRPLSLTTQALGRQADHQVVTRPTLAIVPVYVRDEPEVEVLLKCLVSLQATAPDARVLIVDDHSPSEPMVALVEAAADELGVAFVRKDENTGFAGAVNVGLEVARATELDAVLVNADIEFPQAGWLDVMRARTDTQGRPAAVVGARLLYPTGLLQHAGVYFSQLHRYFGHRFNHGPGDLPEALAPCRCPVTAALQLIRYETLVEVGIYDESFGLAHEDMDYCLRVFGAGLDCIYEPAAVAVHHESMFRSRRSKRIEELHRRSFDRLIEKYGSMDMTAWTPVAL